MTSKDIKKLNHIIYQKAYKMSLEDIIGLSSLILDINV